MSRSGVAVSNDCVAKFNELKLGKNLSYVIYALNDKGTEIVVLAEGEKDDSSPEDKYNKFLEHLQEKVCRYAVYDFEYELAGGEGKRSKILFYTWSPDDAPVRQKMIYASSKDALRRAFNGVAGEIQGTDFSEIAYETVMGKIAKGR